MKRITFGRQKHEVWVFSDALANFVETDLRNRGHSHVAQSEEFLKTVWDEAREWSPDREPVNEVHVALDEDKRPVLASLQWEDLQEAVSALLFMEPTRTLNVEPWPVPG